MIMNYASFFFFNRGSLLTRNLGDLVKKEDFVLDSEYLTTQLVVVPRYMHSVEFLHIFTKRGFKKNFFF